MFAVFNNGTAEIVHGATRFAGFLVNYHGERVEATHAIISQCSGVADSFPPLLNVNGPLIFRTCKQNLNDYLDTNTPNEYLVKDKRMRDPLKQFIRNLGLTALHCEENDIQLDLSKSLEGIYVGDETYPQVKAIAIRGSVGGTKCKDGLRAVYQEIQKKYCSSDAEFGDFINLLHDSVNARDAFESTFFWSKFERQNIMSQFGEFIEQKRGMFVRLIDDVSKVENWRLTMSADSSLAYMVSLAPKNFDPRFTYQAKEIDCLLGFLRQTIDHFSTTGAQVFASGLDFVEYVDSNFTSIMAEVYKGAKCAKERQLF